MKDVKVTKITITKDGKYIYSGDETSTVGYRLVSEQEKNENNKKIEPTYQIMNELLDSELYRYLKEAIESLYELVMPPVDKIYKYGTMQSKYPQGTYLRKIVCDLMNAGEKLRERSYPEISKNKYNFFLSILFEEAKQFENSIIANYHLKKELA